MASLLRQIVAGPRARHPEAGLDLCYVTDNIIATSGPSGTYPQLAYRNPLSQLVKFLDDKHGSEWAIWEFRAEGTGYPDEEVYGRVRHYPWPDHHPPPFALIPLIMGSMRNWLKDKDAADKGRVVVVHCKAGKGRSGTVSCSYLISEEGWKAEDAMQRFTERRMRPGFGAGISIPSQIRWIGYVDRWAKAGKVYVERPVEVLELHVWGLRDGVKIAVEGFVDEGKTIKSFHVFNSSEREVVRGAIRKDTGLADVALEAFGKKSAVKKENQTPLDAVNNNSSPRDSTGAPSDEKDSTAGDIVFCPSSRVVLPSSDIEIDFERRNKSKYGGFTMVTSVAHVWFNAFFEGRGPENDGTPDDSGVFEIDWDAMDGIKGSSRKGTQCFDKMAVLWKAVVPPGRQGSVVITQPAEGEEVRQTRAADWRGAQSDKEDEGKNLGLRAETPESAPISRANSVRSQHGQQASNSSDTDMDATAGTRPLGPDGEEQLVAPKQLLPTSADLPGPIHTVQSPEPMDEKTGELVTGMNHISTKDLPDGKPEEEMHTPSGHSFGHVKMARNTGTSS